jgi:hypothetical protein
MFEPTNPMIKTALEKGEDATGLCTVRDLASYLIERKEAQKKNAEDGELVSKTIETELAWIENGRRINIEIKATRNEPV